MGHRARVKSRGCLRPTSRPASKVGPVQRGAGEAGPGAGEECSQGADAEVRAHASPRPHCASRRSAPQACGRPCKAARVADSCALVPALVTPALLQGTPARCLKLCNRPHTSGSCPSHRCSHTLRHPERNPCYIDPCAHVRHCHRWVGVPTAGADPCPLHTWLHAARPRRSPAPCASNPSPPRPIQVHALPAAACAPAMAGGVIPALLRQQVGRGCSGRGVARAADPRDLARLGHSVLRTHASFEYDACPVGGLVACLVACPRLRAERLARLSGQFDASPEGPCPLVGHCARPIRHPVASRLWQAHSCCSTSAASVSGALSPGGGPGLDFTEGPTPGHLRGQGPLGGQPGGRHRGRRGQMRSATRRAGPGARVYLGVQMQGCCDPPRGGLAGLRHLLPLAAYSGTMGP